MSSKSKLIIRFERLVAADPLMNVSDAASKLGVSARTLRARCYEHYGYAPLAYIHRRRLDGAHLALKRADPRTVSGAAVAMKFGFYELGRFSALYHETFGELPSATLRRSAR